YETRVDHEIIEISLDAKIIGDGTELELLETNNGLKVVSEQFEEFCRLQGGKHSGYTCFETLVEKTQFEVESSDSGTRKRQPTLSPSYLLRDMEGSGIVTPKKYGCEDLVCYICLYAILSYSRKILHMENGIKFSNQDNW
ncbi:hypothetical protein A2U01_0020347, partial [Trifolium medium]|nr:hypothetical protein [Trifolium medium]